MTSRRENTIVSAAEDWLIDWSERVAADPDSIDLPLLPRAASEVLALREREDVDAAHVSKLIHRDPALAAHVLRVANSPLFRGRSEIVSLQQAVARLGMKQLIDLVVTASISATVFRVPGHETRVRTLWTLSLLAGLAAKELARHLRKNVEISFLCGLLHDIGSPIALQALASMHEEHGFTLDSEKLDNILISLSPAIGAALVRRWKLAFKIGGAILYQRSPQSAPHDQDPARITHLSIAMARFFMEQQNEGVRTGLNEDSEHPHTRFRAEHQTVISALNIYPDELEQILNKSEAILETVQVINQ